MKKSLRDALKRAVLLLAVLMAGCVTATPRTSATPPSTMPARPTPLPTVDVATPETIGRAFLAAWEAEDFTHMHNLLLPSLRSGLALADFAQAYQTPLDTTTTISVTLIPKTLSIETNIAWIAFDEFWHTGLFGTLQAENQLRLALEDGQWWIDWRQSTIWPDLIDGNSFAVEYQIPPRANIYAANGAGLAVPSTIVTVGVIPAYIEDETAVLAALSQALAMTPEEITAEYSGQPANWFIPIDDITGEESLAYDELLSLPGIERRERPGRLYPLDGVGAHVTGWMSPIPAESYAEYRRRGYRGDELVGISGLEAWGESILAGRNGGRLAIAAGDGNYVRGVAERTPERGRAIYTTLDRELQYSAEQALNDRRGAIVAIDIDTGGVLALASGPRFDNNVFIQLSDVGPRQAVLNDPNLPLLNRATQGQYPSGSIFKIVTMAAGLEAAGLTADTTFVCPGYWDGLGSINRKFCWLESGHGNITLKNGLSASCNVTFYEVGAILDNLDANTLPTYGRAFGFGDKTGLQALPEAAGLIPDPAWKMATYAQPWGTGDTVNLAIGQGFLLVTPLQVARMMAAVANGGTLYRPYVVARIEGNAGSEALVTQPQAVGRLPVSAEHLTIIQEALLGVTTESFGTATHRFAGLGIPVAGKTGSAEPANENDLPHSWFTGYFPADDPQIAMVVMVENAGEGSSVAAPMFRQVIEYYYGLPVTPLPVIPPATEGD